MDREQYEVDRQNAELELLAEATRIADQYRKPGTGAGDGDPYKYARTLSEVVGLKMAPTGWANAEQRAKGRAAYAMESDDPYEIRERWDQSRLLMDPATAAAQKEHLRNFKLLQGLARRDDPALVLKEYQNPPDYRLAPDMVNRNAPVESASGQIDPIGVQFLTTGLPAILQNLMDPESNGGWYMGRSNIVPNAGRLAGGAEAKNIGEALGHSAGILGYNEMYRQNSRTPVADLPDDATPEQIKARVAELQQQGALMDAPESKERWLRTHGVDPGPVVNFASDLGYDFLDPSLLVDVAAGPAKSAVRAIASPAARAYMAARGGLLNNLTKNAAKEGAGELAMEAGTEVPVQVAINAAAGAERGKKYGDHDVKTPEELAEAQRLRGDFERRHFGWNDPSKRAYNEDVLPAIRNAMRKQVQSKYPDFDGNLDNLDPFGRPMKRVAGPFSPLSE
jgi:hypothetical protein